MSENRKKIVFFGDSLTQRTGIIKSPIPSHRFSLDYAESYVEILMKRLTVNLPSIEFEYYNKGVGGNTSEDLLNRVEEDVLSINPDIVCLFIGQNDADCMSVDTFEANLNKLLALFKTREIRVLQCSTTPSPGDPDKNLILDLFDEIIKQSAEKYHNRHIELKKHFVEIMNRNNDEAPIVLFNDGCHFSELGNVLVADLVFDSITKGSGIGNLPHLR